MIPFDGLVERFKIQATGVLHIGANRGQEFADYNRHGITKQIWIEALPNVFEDLCRNVSGKDVVCLNECISDVDDHEVDFHESNNESQSSSFLELGVHKEIHPTVEYIGTTKMKTKRIDTILTREQLQGYQLLNIDIQGPELLALKGMGILLHHFKYAIIEINMRETYVGGAMVDEIDNYMSIFNFVRAETGDWVASTWTDGFYIKKYLL